VAPIDRFCIQLHCIHTGTKVNLCNLKICNNSLKQYNVELKFQAIKQYVNQLTESMSILHGMSWPYFLFVGIVQIEKP
jgi:hypothetical protein